MIARSRISLIDSKMAACASIDPEVASLFGETSDEESFDGFGEGELDSESDIDFDGLQPEEDEPSYNTEDEDEEAQWTAQLTRVRVPRFNAETGITFDVDNPNELDVFLNFIDNHLWDLMVEESNRNAKEKLGDRFSSFRRITREELKAFIGINIIMGINRLPNYALFWSTDDFFGNHGIKRTMPKNRYEELVSYLHFNDSSQGPARGDANYDRLYKVRPIFDYILNKCKTNFKPTKNISVDEGMIAFQGRLSFRQYMPAKPTKYGIKVWMAADSSNGYVLNFDVYLGKEGTHRRIYGLGYDVTKLIRPFMNKNHHVYFDNFFSSTTLLEHLEANKTYACATVRCNRKDLPRCAKEKLRPGQKVVSQKGNVMFTKWHDKWDVSVLSTNNCNTLSADIVVNRNNDQQVTKPAVVDMYNKNMGGVDLADQLRQYYSVGRSSRRWYRYIFWFLVDLSICNSFILFNNYRLGQGQGKVKQLNFRINLAKQLIGGFSCTASLGHATKHRKIENLSFSAANVNRHFSVHIEGRKKVCVQCKRVGRKTPKGRSVETSFQCLQCNVPLCKTCFNAFHMYDD